MNINQHTMTELVQLVIEWGNKRGLLQERYATRQMLKVTEEIGELAGALAKRNEIDIMDAVGDSFVTLIILSAQLGLDPAACLNFAYEQIADRKGQTIDGVFIKES
jgi:NTP pyrophosphatase (non-canonical NTP hydrolase)